MCPTAEQLEMTQNEIRSEILTIIHECVLPPQPTYECEGMSGWTRVAFINMTDPSQECPSGLALTTYSKRTCVRTISTDVTQYHSVLEARHTAVSVGESLATSLEIVMHFSGTILEELPPLTPHSYVAGVSLTHGAPGPRQHIWTFAVVRNETDQSGYSGTLCPCSTTGNVSVPPFVGNNYFCESGLNTAYTGSSQYELYLDDPLWDGQNCRAGTTCCQFNTPPWFTRDLPTSTSDDIELRLCYEDDSNFEDIPLELIELYVQ